MQSTRRATRYVLGLVLLLLTCTSRATDPTGPEDAETKDDPLSAEPEANSLSTMQAVRPSVAATVVDPYAGWAQWCEPLWYEHPCTDHAECSDIAHVARRPLRCVRPWWSKRDDLLDSNGEPLKICAPGFTARTERRWRRSRLRELVAQTYFDEPGRCPDWSWSVTGGDGKPKRFERVWANAKPTHKQHWRCTQEARAAQQLADFLWVPYFRETTARPWKRHRLDADVAANKTAWVKEAHAYGWKVELACEDGRDLSRDDKGVWRDAKGRRCRNGRDSSGKYSRNRKVIADYVPDPMAERHNPYYGERHRWQFGNGGVGKNTAYGTQDWDMMAPPEILCREVEGFEAYLRDARRAVSVLSEGGVDCGETERYHGRATVHVLDPGTKDVVEQREIAAPSWSDVHRVASGGKFCPRNGASGAAYARKFAARMTSVGLRASAPVTLEMLGKPIPRETQNERASAVLARIEAVLPPAWPVPGAPREPPPVPQAPGQADISTGSTR